MFQPHKAKSTASIPRSATTQCIPSPAAPLTLNQQIDDYLHNADQYNQRLSSTRFSGFLPTTSKMDAAIFQNLNEGDKLGTMSSEGHARTSSASSYRTAPDDLIDDFEVIQVSERSKCK